MEKGKRHDGRILTLNGSATNRQEKEKRKEKKEKEKKQETRQENKRKEREKEEKRKEKRKVFNIETKKNTKGKI